MKGNSVSKKLHVRKKWIAILAPVCSVVVAGAITTAVLLTNNAKKKIDEGGTDIVAPNGSENNGNHNGDHGNGGNNDNNGDHGATSGTGNENSPTGGATNGGDTPSTPTGPNTEGNDQTVSGTTNLFADPVKTMDISHSFGFYYNATLNKYYEHKGIDVSAEAGEEVYATTAGKITAIYTGDPLEGNTIELLSSDGVKTVYHFIDPLETVFVGKSVNKGDKIGLVSEATGNEYKDGAHVHVEVYRSGTAVDPEDYLTSSEK